MTKIKNIRVFDEFDHRYEVNEIDINQKEGSLWIYINRPEINLPAMLMNNEDPQEIEDSIENILSLEGIPITKVRYFVDSNIILLRFADAVATIHIAEKLQFCENAITPYENGYAYINVNEVIKGELND